MTSPSNLRQPLHSTLHQSDDPLLALKTQLARREDETAGLVNELLCRRIGGVEVASHGDALSLISPVKPQPSQVSLSLANHKNVCSLPTSR